MSQVLAGHLAIEFLLRKLICQYDPKLEALVDDLTHARLILLNRAVGTLSSERADVLTRINALRNRFAHEIGYEPELAELAVLFEAALLAFSDYADGLKSGLAEITSATSTYQLSKWLLAELFLAVIYDLHQECIARGCSDD
jgi:hypothetical protein